MVATNLKVETIKLMDQRTALESEIESIINYLCAADGPGITGSLVDIEGYPRADIDIPMVLARRGRLKELKNDHADLTKKIQENIEVLHSSRLRNKSSTSNGSASIQRNQNDCILPPHSSVPSPESVAPASVNANFGVPFAVIGEISEGSPAAEDGLQLGDLIVKYGNVEHQEEGVLERLASETAAKQGVAIPVSLLRQGSSVCVHVTPRKWQGRGFLGCSFRIL